MNKIKRLLVLLFLLVSAINVMMTVTAQTQNPRPTQGNPQSPPPPLRPPGGGGFANTYLQRPPASPEVLERGKALYSVHGSFCHGSDARGGGEGGPSLIRSEIMLNDPHGELLAPVVQNGRAFADDEIF
jgi:cytochrome c oxidase cbb3-type subunit 3